MNPTISRDEAIRTISSPEGGSNFIGAMAKSDAVVGLDGTNDQREAVKDEIKAVAADIEKDIFEDDIVAADIEGIKNFYSDAYFAGAITKEIYEKGVQRIQETWKDRILASQTEARPLMLWKKTRELFVKGDISAEGYLNLKSKLQQKSVDFFMYEMSIKISAWKPEPQLFNHYKELAIDMADDLRKQGVINYVQYVEMLRFAENDLKLSNEKKDELYKEFDPILKHLGVI